VSAFKNILMCEYPGLPRVAKPTVESLSIAEVALGLKFPKSYRDFALHFGAGIVAGSFQIYAPLPKVYKFNGEPMYEIVYHNSVAAEMLNSCKLRVKKGRRYQSVDSQFCLFSIDNGGNVYAWNLNELTQQDAFEYRIYQIVHTDEIYPYAITFEDFVKRSCELGGTPDPPSSTPSEREPNWTFMPFTVPSKR